MRADYKELDCSKKILITGGAGFIGYHLSRRLLEYGCTVMGLDNMNDYYDVRLKEDRLSKLQEFERYQFIKADLADMKKMEEVFGQYRPSIVVNLGAQLGTALRIRRPICSPI